jgi:hypothetical protein
MKVTGIPRDDGAKDYSIKHNGTNYKAVRSGSLFLCNGMKGTLKEIKEHIASGSMTEDEPETESVQVLEPGLWDCVHPCALLVLITDALRSGEDVPDQVFREVSVTLDKYGWGRDISEDLIRADREMSNFTQREGG